MQVRYSTGGAETIICEFDVAWGAVQQYYTFSEAVDVYINEGSTLYISYYLVSGSDGYVVNAKNLTSVVSECRFKSTLGVSVYNSADNTVVTHVCNRLPTNARLRLNTDGSGDFQYHVADLSTTDYWTDEGYYLDNCEHLNGLKINSSGCFIYDFDTKYPMTGNITVACTYSVVGAFFIRYALDDGTGNPGKFTSVAVYADGSATTSVAINLAGQTKFYIEFATAGGSEVTLTYIDVSVQISPLTAVFPVIVGNGVTNTFVANQSAGTGIYCSILLWYEERRWGLMSLLSWFPLYSDYKDMVSVGAAEGTPTSVTLVSDSVRNYGAFTAASKLVGPALGSYFANQFTFTAWVNYGTGGLMSGTDNIVMSIGDVAFSVFPFGYTLPEVALYIDETTRHFVGKVCEITCDTGFEAHNGRWYHLTFEYNATYGIRIYVDGILRGTTNDVSARRLQRPSYMSVLCSKVDYQMSVSMMKYFHRLR